ncbi:MAG: protease SohB [Cellvibrionaceae bacterium]
MEFLTEYGLFLAKSVTIVITVLIIIGFAMSAGQKHKGDEKGHIEITRLNDKYEATVEALKDVIVDEATRKEQIKAQEKKDKAEAKARKKNSKKALESDAPDETKPRVFVLNFDGDIKASAVENIREEITSVLGVASENDEVVVRLESGGGMVHSYGLASSQLDRIKKQNIPLTVCVDKVAASGGYMMACVADKILAAPFAIMGSIGVVAQLPNFHRLLKKNNIDFEMLTAGEHKRTLTMFGENTDKDREKFVEDLEDTHDLFKGFVTEHRPAVNIDEVANGDVWYGKRALDNHLVDELMTSDEYINNRVKSADVFEVEYTHRKTLQEKLGITVQGAADRLIITWLTRLRASRFF